MSVCAAAGLLSTWQATVLKGNAGELAAIANSTEVQAKGVDSVGTGFADPAAFVRALARQHRESPSRSPHLATLFPLLMQKRCCASQAASSC